MKTKRLLVICLTLQAAAVGWCQSPVDYARDVAPLLARHCLECHGPAKESREAGLRLDSREDATARLESGNTAVTPGQPTRSELLRRVRLTGEGRMPPPDAGEPLTKREVQRLSAWIQQGADWSLHWAFAPPRPQPPPEVRHTTWPRNSIDQFILARLKQAGLTPTAEADRRTLLRRAYFDLLGVPPTPREAKAFLTDSRSDAWEHLVDRLLASPLYGQRWGRHWLDVARYGDSNGGDENHAYPLAWRYRDYVIQAFNEDLPYDVFLQEQLAGDLLSQADDRYRHAERVTATGFLALGTKILAERDKVKMRADLVDEQIDTVGKSFLALTLGCARCHDHKFDPIPATDYYALAGILHSTQLGDQQITTDGHRLRKARFDQQLADLQGQRKKLQETLASGDLLDRQAESFDRGNVQAISDGYGEGIGVISDPGPQENFVEYDIQLAAGGEYLLQLRYAAKNARPGRALLNGAVVREKAIGQATGGWMPEHQRWWSEGVHTFKKGKNVLRLESAPLMSHIDRFRLIRYEQGGGLAKKLTRLEHLDVEIASLLKKQPQPVRVMGVSDGKAVDVRLHLRGSHLSLGDAVPRGFPEVVSARRVSHAGDTFAISSESSGRLQLAQWMTNSEFGAGGQAARVIVNRAWHWHFGRGLVATPDNFGKQGKPPTHPRLLDWMALQLIENGWSLKSLHRQIMSSATYRQSAGGDDPQLYRGFQPRRLEAEVIRDSLLFHSGRLDVGLSGEPLMVKTQDPSPQDLKKNEIYYRKSRRRSVYLPVVRSNVYRFLTLFDFPNAATPVGSRDSTTVPTQALLLLNDSFVMEQAEQLAQRLLHDSRVRTDQQRLAVLYQQLFSRSPSVGEQRAALEFLEAFRRTLSKTDDGPGELAVWSSLCHTLLLSSEFVYVE